jgi:ribosome maturation factor RimP
VLKLAVDKPGGVAVGDCERASREIGDVLDAAGVIGSGYDLEVSSPGLDRRLRSDREFRWAIGKRVRCWQSGGAETHGRLREVSGEQLVLEHEGQRIEVPRATVTKARLDAELPWPRRA